MGYELTAAEQLLIELINRARLNPQAEAARYGIDLNEGLAPGTISGGTREALAPNALLARAADAHSGWMLETDSFGHTGAGGSSSNQRMRDAGYDFSGSWRSGENVSLTGSTDGIDLVAAIQKHHSGLFQSAGHRENILEGDFREIGVGQADGRYSDGGRTYDASLLTEDFARSGKAAFLTGVVYDDRNGDDFYSVGEGQGGTSISAGKQAVTSQSAGGYALELGASGWVTVEIAQGGRDVSLRVDMSGGNVKLDIVGGDHLLSSGSLDMGSGFSDAGLLGLDDLSLIGNAAGNALNGNAGDNKLVGEGGDDILHGGRGQDRLYGSDGDDILYGEQNHDRLYGGDGNDAMFGGNGHDRLSGGAGSDRLVGEDGNDRMYGNDDDDNLFGGYHTDFLYGGADDDRLLGEEGNDRLSGGEGDDVLYGADGRDRLYGNAGNDSLYGGVGSDKLTGGLGNDMLKGDAGGDLLIGGAGADTFVFDGGFGRDRIADFQRNDILRFEGVGEAGSFAEFLGASRQSGSDVIYDMHGDGANVIVFDDLHLSDLSAGQFDFI